MAIALSSRLRNSIPIQSVAGGLEQTDGMEQLARRSNGVRGKKVRASRTTRCKSSAGEAVYGAATKRAAHASSSRQPASCAASPATHTPPRERQTPLPQRETKLIAHAP